MDRAGHWFLRSGIQEPSGGVARYYRSDLKRNQAVSTEITGYAAGAFAWLHGLTAETRYLDASLRAARFLTRVAWDGALSTFPFELPQDGAGPQLAYFFDLGIIVRGLLAAARATGEQEFLDAARCGGRAMVRDFLDEGEIRPIVSLPEKRPLPHGETWSRRPGCYQLKAAMAWKDLGGDFERNYETALARALAGHEEFLPGAEAPGSVMDRLHAYCYFLEGLLPAAGRPECRRVLAEGIARTARWLRDIAPQFARSDVYAQLLRLRLIADAAGFVPLDEAAARQEAAAILPFQMSSDDQRVDGGFCFGRKAGAMQPSVNPVSTAFSIQALAMWERTAVVGRLDLI